MKKQLKKSLSLFLAVLMVLSCWVWVAPQKASADHTTGQYYVKVVVDISTYSEMVGTNNLTIHYLKNNGMGGTDSVTVNPEKKSYQSVATGVVLFSQYVDGYPTSMALELNLNYKFGGTTLWITNTKIYVGKDANSCTNVVFEDANGTSDNYEWKSNTFGNGDVKTFTCAVDSNTNPYIASADNMPDTSVTCPAWGTDTVNTTKANAAMPTYWDQYGVKWIDTVNPTYHVSASARGDAIGGTEETGVWTSKDGYKGYVNVNAKLQEETAMPAADGTKDLYMVATVTNSAGTPVLASQKITVNYNKVKFIFNADGSISGLGASVMNPAGTKIIGTGTYDPNDYYGITGSFPSNKSVVVYEDINEGILAGYTFYGFWTDKQPTSGNASFNALEANYAQPCTDDEYENYKKITGATVDDAGIVIVDSDGDGAYEKYYPAGEKWDETVTTFDGNRTYYGWWLRDDISVKFYDIDGTYFGEQTVKYGQIQSDVTWPESKYVDLGYTSGSFTYKINNNLWIGSDGEEVSKSSYTFKHNLLLTPGISESSFDSEYEIEFVDQNPDNNGNVTNIATHSKMYSYRDTVTVPAARNIPQDIASDLKYEYTFLGWSAAEPINGRYHVLLEDADFDVDGKAVGINEDWIVRDEATYYPVYRRHTRSYVVNFWYRDATATEVSKKVVVKYGETLTPPVDVVPDKYATGGYGYTFTNWKYTDGEGTEATLGYAEPIIFTSDYINIELGAVEGAGGAIAIQAAYGEGVPTPYTVTFITRNEKGEKVPYTAEVSHGNVITQDIISNIATANEYDNGEALVKYTDRWNVVEGAAGKEVYETNELTSFSPTSHITFEAEYGNPKYFYTVTYVDGTKTKEYRILEGDNLEQWTEKVLNPDVEGDEYIDEVYVPSMADDERGSYEFQGWFDEKQTDTSYSTTNGKRHYVGEEVTGDLTLYPQFKYTPFKYTITFLSHDGVQLAANKYEYGQNFSDIFYWAQRAAQTRPADEMYEYQFIGWDQPYNEDNLVCEGKDVTYTALYKASYRYYNAKWYNSTLVDGKWVADKTTAEEDGETVETGLLATTYHTYDSKLYTPSVKAVCTATAPEGQEYVFAGWCYKDEDGNEHKYVRGMLITSEMEFYATYTLTKEKLTVTTVVEGEEAEYSVVSGEKATIPDPESGFVDADKHNEFTGWYTVETCDCTDTCEHLVDFDTTDVTSNLKVYARFAESAHDYTNWMDTQAPTYYAKGVRSTWCSCNPEKTTKTTEIDKLTDGVAPTGTIYLGTLGKWSSTDTQGAAATDGDPVNIYANAKTDVIINTNDTGKCDGTSEDHDATTCVNCLYNPSGLGIGIKSIQAFAFPGDITLTATNFGAAQEVAVTVFEDTSETLNGTANYTIKLGDLLVADLDENGNPQHDADGNVISKHLEDGETYIIYYSVRDKANNLLNRFVRTAKFIYDTTAPTVTVEGEGDNATTGTPVYCEKATVKVAESDTTLTVNGEAKAYTSTAANGAGTYTITEAGNYIITVTDKAGNSASKKIRVAAHDYATKTADATCTEGGYEKTECLTCGHVKSESTTTAIGHLYEMAEAIPANCLENGSITIKCANCDHTITTEYEVDENGDFVLEDGEKVLAFPALGHEYETDADGEIVYTTVIVPTCMTKGKAVAYCKVCGSDDSLKVKELDCDSENHKLGTLKTLEPTCTDAGMTYRVCKLCTVHYKVADIPATGHDDGVWVVTKEATCEEAGLETLTCTVCNEGIDGDDEDTVADTREIAKTEDHNYVYVDTVTVGEVQYAVYKCSVCGHEKKEEVKVEEVVKYTVTFIKEDGTAIQTLEKVVGETVATAPEAPAKKDADGVNKYTFAYWAVATLKDGKYTAGEQVKLPLTVSEDVTIMPVYTETKIIYTHQFITYNAYTQVVNTIAEGEETQATWEYTDAAVFETMMNVVGGKAVPSKTPTIKETDLFTFEFVGWADAKGVMVNDFTVTVDETTGKADRTFYAVFKAVPKEYKVTFLANGTEYVWHTTVKGGESVTFGGTLPTKDYDDNYHYTFTRWNLDAAFTTEYTGQAITSDTRLYASFTATAHSYDKSEGKGTVKQEADCVLPEITEYKCSCGHTITEETEEALGHTPKTAVQEKDETTGIIYNVVYCEVCDEVISKTATTVKVIFDYNNNATTSVIREYNYGEKISVPATEPVKAPDAQNTYKFIGWYDGDTLVDFENTEVKALADVTYVAKYESTDRVYNVTYVDLDHKTLKNHQLKYGETVPAYDGATPTKKYDGTNHYDFAGWSVAAGTTVTGDLMIQPKFTAVAHSYTKGNSAPSCTEAGGIIYTCSCGYSYNDPLNSIPATGHTWEIVTIPATYEKDGLEKKTCSVCGEYEEVTIPKLEHRTVNVTVKDSKGNVIEGAKVELYKDGAWVATDFSDANGKATFTVKDSGKYTVVVSGVEDGNNIDYDINVGDEGFDDNGKPSETVTITECKCSCHRDGFWGTIFRFFHKIIKLFTGKIKCCSCPDGRY